MDSEHPIADDVARKCIPRDIVIKIMSHLEEKIRAEYTAALTINGYIFPLKQVAELLRIHAMCRECDGIATSILPCFACDNPMCEKHDVEGYCDLCTVWINHCTSCGMHFQVCPQTERCARCDFSCCQTYENMCFICARKNGTVITPNENNSRVLEMLVFPPPRI